MRTRLSLLLTVLIVFHCLSPIGCALTPQQQKDTYSARLGSLPPDVNFPQDLKGKISYDAQNERLTFKGVMTEEERDELLKLSRNVQYSAAVVALYNNTQKNTKERQQSSYETDPYDSMGVLKRASEDTRNDVQEKPTSKRLAQESYETDKKSSARVAALEEEKKTDPVEKQVSESQPPNSESEDFVRNAAAQIAAKFEEKFPPTKGDDFTVLVQPFATLDGRYTTLSYLLAEELFTLLSNSPWVGGSLKICCNPIDGGPTPNRLDGIISGSLTQIGDEIKINARLVSADNHVIIAAISTRIPASETAKEFLKAEIIPKKPAESEDLDTRLDSLAWQTEQILHDLHGDKEGTQRLCILDFHTLGDKKNLLGRFLAEECTLRLSKNKSWKFVPSTRVEELLGGQVSSISALTATDLEKLAKELGIGAVVEGTVMDLGNSVKVNVKVADTKEGVTWGTASVDIPVDKRVAYLLSKERGQTPVYSSSGTVTEALKAAYPKQEEGSSLTNQRGEEFFLNEDFSGPEVVNRLEKWGKDLIVTNEGGKHFLASSNQEFVNIGKEVDFPSNFFFEFDVKGSSKYWNTLKFTDAAGNEFGIDFQLDEGNCYIVLPGPKSVRVRVDTNSANRFKLVRKDDFYEVYVNDTLGLAGPYSKYMPFKGFSITARLDQVRFTDFKGKTIIKG